jgi:hypothetical protein
LHCACLIVCCDKGIDKHKFFIAGSDKARGTHGAASSFTLDGGAFRISKRFSRFN